LRHSSEAPSQRIASGYFCAAQAETRLSLHIALGDDGPTTTLIRRAMQSENDPRFIIHTTYLQLSL
jgi:hypothetical protein